MKLTSKTGLIASQSRDVAKICHTKKKTLQLGTVARRASFTLKPFSGLFNPYPGQCSLLCNHPVAPNAKLLLKKAKESWTNENAKCVLTSHRETFETEFQKREDFEVKREEVVPEELFRRYTDTDSRPLTPAPTLASAGTHASGSRRCVTPEGVPRRPRARLILNLRRSHSQETIAYSASLNELPLIHIQHAPTKLSRTEGDCSRALGSTCHHLSLSTPREVKTSDKRQHNSVPAIHVDENDCQLNGTGEENKDKDESNVSDEDIITRCGKKRKKKARDQSRGPHDFESQLDPETQVSTVELNSKSQTARSPSVTGINYDNNDQDTVVVPPTSAKPLSVKVQQLEVESFLDINIIRHLKRELNEEIVDMELDFKRHKALQEALKAVPKNATVGKELATLQNNLKLNPMNGELWLTMPRSFSRSSARFELPMNGSVLSEMTPLDYVKQYISITNERKLLYNCIFNRFKMEAELENEHERKMPENMVKGALGLVMGRSLTAEEYEEFSNMVGWNEGDIFDFRTFCGVAALCERVFAPRFVAKIAPDRKEDPCHEIEVADFKALERKLSGRKIDQRLEIILNMINTL